MLLIKLNVYVKNKNKIYDIIYSLLICCLCVLKLLNLIFNKCKLENNKKLSNNNNV